VDWSRVDWAAVDRLRKLFLAGPAPGRIYWQSHAELETYDLTFAQRIGWKWDAVLRELELRGWRPPSGPVLDWGCGTGIAARRVLEFFGPEQFDQVWFYDHSVLATQFAVEVTRAEFGGLRIEPVGAGWLTSGEPIGLLLISHVLSELTQGALQALLRWMDRAQSVIWVEPGTHADSRRLGSLRERLRRRFAVLAPCTHQAACGILAPHNARHWCHFFAEAPPALMADPDWARFAQRAEVDLRSLPYSFLVLEKAHRGPIRQAQQPTSSCTVACGGPSEAVRPDLIAAGVATAPSYSRVIGRPRFYKGLAKVFSCQLDGVLDLILRERTAPDLFQDIQTRTEGLIYQWVRAGDEIRGGHRWSTSSITSNQSYPPAPTEGSSKSAP
jgi:hypothetical protein